MTRKLLAFGCAALTVLMLSAILNPADARRGGGGGQGFGRGFGGHGFSRGFSGGPRFHGGPKVYGGPRFHHGRRHHHRRFRGIYLGAPYVFYDDYYSYGGCSWLRQRALRTGSSYWWNRYYACIGD
jgi:hypothetical protein